MEAAIAAASPQNKGRQPVTGISQCTGNVEATMPKEPVISIQELARSWAVGVSQRRKPVSGAIRQALTPPPQSMRAISRPEKLAAAENARQTPRARITKR